MSADPIKTYDARWEVVEFDDVAVRRLFTAALTYGRELGADTVVLTRDARLAAGHTLELGLEAALRLGWRVVWRPEPISTPQAYFTTHWATVRWPGTIGLAVTASHNPAGYIGVKFTVPAVRAVGLDCGPQGGLTRIRALYHDGPLDPARDGGELLTPDLRAEYEAYSLATAGVAPGSLAGLSVVLDTFNGSAGPELYSILTAAGVRLHTRRLVPDGTFPTGSPNPTSQGKLDASLDLLAATGADVLLGVDGDGDRLVFGSGRGLLTAGFAMLGVLAAAGLPTGAKVLYDPKVSPLALAAWGELGLEPILFRNGHSQIKDYMLATGALAAAEESGHYYHRLTLDGVSIASENSAVTALLFLRALHTDHGLLARLHDAQDAAYTTGEFNYQFADDPTRDAALAALCALAAERGASAQTHSDDGQDLEGTALSWGVRALHPGVELSEGWWSGYVRAATTEPAVARAYWSAGDAAVGQQLEAETRALWAERFGGQVVE